MLEKPTKKKRALKAYAKYSSLTIQMVLIIVLAFFLGEIIDSKTARTIPMATILFSLAGIAAALLYVFNKIRSDEK